VSDISNEDEFKDIIKLKEEISNFFEDLMYDRGGSPLLGRIFALCVSATPQKPLLQRDLVDKFEVNPSTISRNLKELEKLRLIDRRREPGSREWKYQVEDTAYRELLLNKIEEDADKLQERKDALIRIRDRWGNTLSQDSKKTESGKQSMKTLNSLIEWIIIVENELNSLIRTLHNRYAELEKGKNL
jgi:DNA-binding transcriptional regulator GbsR (MarR family)